MSPLQATTHKAVSLSDPPIIISTYPDSGQRNVYLNTLVKVTFNQNMSSSSIVDTTFLVVKQDTFDPVSATITFDSGTRTATLTPSDYLDADSTYIAIVVGNQDEHARVPVGVKNYYEEAMVGNYSWQFYTGFSVSTDPEYAALASGVTGYEEPQYPDPSGFTKEGFLEVSWTEPENYDSNVPISGTVVEIQLSDSLDIEQSSGLGQMVVSEDYIDSYSSYLGYYIEVENEPSIGDHMIPANDWEYDIYYNEFLNKVTLSGVPSTVSINGYYNVNGVWQELGILYGMLEENNQYTITVKSGLAGLNTCPLVDDYVFMFTTIFDPLFSSATIIRLNIGPLIRNIPDDTLNRIIHENSIRVQQLYPTWAGLISANNIPYYVSEYVMCQSKLDALNAALLDWGGAGGRKTLADLTIEKESPGRDILYLAQKKIDELEKCIYEMKNLVEQGGYIVSPDYAVIARDDSRRPVTDKSWRRLPKLNPDQRIRPGTASAVSRRRSIIFGHDRGIGRYGKFT